MLKGLLSGLKALVRGGGDEDWDFGDRRELVRLSCHYDVEFVHKGKKQEGRIVDLGLKGMRLRGFHKMKKGDEVDVTYSLAISALHETIRCKVLWCRQREKDFVTFVGLGYPEDDKLMRKSWIKQVLQEVGFGKSKIYEKRKLVRAECFVPGELVSGHCQVQKGQLYNLGVGGALIQLKDKVDIGSEVELRIGPHQHIKQFSLNGKVVQCRPHMTAQHVGVQFDSPSDEGLAKLSECLLFLLKTSWNE